MRKLILQVQISVDGYIAGPHGEMDWLVFDRSEDIKDYVTALTERTDTILLGKNLAMGFIPHWAGVAKEETNPEREAGMRFSTTPKIVFSTTLKHHEWAHTEIENGDFVQRIQQLKQEPGVDMIAYGGGQFVSSLLRENLVDELHLFVNPAILGTGMPIFESIPNVRKMKTIDSKRFDCGITLLVYKHQNA